MEELERIDAALNRPWYMVRMERGFERDFGTDTGPARRKQIATSLALLLVVSLSWLPLDLQSHVLYEGLVMRLGVETPVILICLRILRRDRPSWLECLAGALPVAITLGLTVPLGLWSVPPFTDRYLMAAGAVGFMSNIMVPLRFSHAAVLSACNVSIYCGISLSGLVATPPAQATGYVVFFAGMMILTLRDAAQRERASKDRYLFTRRDRLQNQELARLVSELTRMADRDALTDVGNRRCFDRTFDLMWSDARTENGRLAIAMIDVDRFKSFNDAAGHSEGDRCLRAVARVIAEQVRPNRDVVTRYGGEEFAVLMPIANEVAAQDVAPEVMAERIRWAVAAQNLAHPGLGLGGCVTVSLGVAIAAPGRDPHTPTSLLEAADRALYEAKDEGRNCVRLAVSKGLAHAA